MSDQAPPQYGERVSHPASSTPPVENHTKFVNEAPTNEHDVQVAHLMLRRSIVRATGTVLVFTVLMSPIVTALIVGGMNQ